MKLILLTMLCHPPAVHLLVIGRLTVLTLVVMMQAATGTISAGTDVLVAYHAVAVYFAA